MYPTDRRAFLRLTATISHRGVAPQDPSKGGLVSVAGFIARLINRNRQTGNSQHLRDATANRVDHQIRSHATSCSEHVLVKARNSFMTFHRRAVNLGESYGDHELLEALGEIRHDLADAYDVARDRILEEAKNRGHDTPHY